MDIVAGKQKLYELDGPRVNLLGQSFGALLVTAWEGFTYVGTAKKRRGVWKCKCKCGNTVQVIHANLSQGNRMRCGFLCTEVPNKQKGTKRINTGKPAPKTHEERKVFMRASYLKNREKRIAYSKKYREENPDKVQTSLKKWKAANPTYKKDRWASDIEFRLKEILRGRLYKAIINQIKYQSALDLVGCTTEQLKQHLELQFTNLMSWDNYGDWHIDHIKPIAAYDMKEVVQQKECFHYTNLQPLWKEDNLKKGTTYE